MTKIRSQKSGCEKKMEEIIGVNNNNIIPYLSQLFTESFESSREISLYSSPLFFNDSFNRPYFRLRHTKMPRTRSLLLPSIIKPVSFWTFMLGGDWMPPLPSFLTPPPPFFHLLQPSRKRSSSSSSSSLVSTSSSSSSLVLVGMNDDEWELRPNETFVFIGASLFFTHTHTSHLSHTTHQEERKESEWVGWMRERRKRERKK